MYQVFFNDYPIYDPRSDVLRIREPDAHLAVGESGSMSFLMDSDHPHADKITRMKGVLRLVAGGRTILKSRVRKDTLDFSLVRKIEAEGLLACLNDSVIPPFNFPDDFLEDAAYQTAAESGNVIRFFLEWILAEHNSQVGPEQQIQLGDVTVTDPNNYISRASSDYLTAMDVVKKKLVDLLGGHLLADYSGETTVLHYYADLPLTNLQEVEFGENLLDLETELSAEDPFTSILPVGKDGLTMAELEDGEVSPGIVKDGLILYNAAAEAESGGRITKKVDWKDVTEAANLRTKAAAKLTAEGSKHVMTITCKAVDLGGRGDIPHFMVGRYVQLKSPPHGFADAYPLMELNPDILNPGNTQITLGSTAKAASDMAHGNQSSLEDKQDQQQIELDKQQGSIEELVQSTKEQITSAIQTCEQILFAALESYATTSDLEAFKQTVEAQFSVMSDEISMKFTETTEHIVNVDGDLQKTVETLSKYFDFGIDGLTIKAGENAMNLSLDNDLIIFKKNGQQFGWWDGVDFHTGNIVIAVTERAQFGNFAFVPRSNGSLSFLKVGG
jgi:hypothetical protein